MIPMDVQMLDVATPCLCFQEMIDVSDHASQLLELRFVLSQVSELTGQLDSRMPGASPGGPTAGSFQEGTVTAGEPPRSPQAGVRGKSSFASGTPMKTGGTSARGGVAYGNVWARDLISELIERGQDVRERLRACLEMCRTSAGQGSMNKDFEEKGEEKGGVEGYDSEWRDAMERQLEELSLALEVEVRH